MKRYLSTILKIGIPVLLVVAVLVFVCSSSAYADFGNFAGKSDYGGGSRSSDSYDSDGSSFFFALLLMRLLDFLPLPIRLIVIVAVIVIYIIVRNRGRRMATTTQQAQPQPTAQTGLMPIASYQSLDPNFDQSAMIEKLSNLYVQMQDCWTKKNIDSLRPYFTDAQFAQYNRQLEESKRAQETNHVERVAVLSVVLMGYYQSGGNDHIVANLQTRITTYTTNDITGEIVRGNQNEEHFMTYEWDLVRPSGQTTRVKSAVETISCPHCGAPLDINQSAKCPYCDSVITVENHDFVIYSIKGLAQRTQ